MEQTALRETFEEVLIPPSHITLLGRFLSTPDKTATIEVHPFIGFIHTPAVIDPSKVQRNTSEVEEVFTISIEELLRPKVKEEMVHRHSGVKIPVWHCGEHRVWGLTAYILHQVLTHVIVPVAGMQGGNSTHVVD